MDRKRNKKYRNWNNQKSFNKAENNANSNIEKNPVPNSKFRYVAHENLEVQQKKEQAINELKAREIICPKCGQIITDVASSLCDKTSGNPVHFECVMNELEKSEKVGQNEKICYIGQGRFGILYFENPRDQRHFTIKKIIEWEERDKKSEWREEMSGLFSQVD